MSPRSLDASPGSQASLIVDLTICLNYRAAPGLGAPIGDDGKPGGVLNKQSKSAALRVEPAPTDAGLVIDFDLGDPAPSSSCAAPKSNRLVNGVPLGNCEQRFAVLIQRIPGTPPPRGPDRKPPKLVVPLKTTAGAFEEALDDTRLVVEVNRAGACVQTGVMLTDDLYGACRVAASPSPAPSATPKPLPSASPAQSAALNSVTQTGSETPAAGSDAPAKSGTMESDSPQTDEAMPTAPRAPSSSFLPTGSAAGTKSESKSQSDAWAGKLTVPWSALNEIFTRPVPPTIPSGSVHWKNADEQNAQIGSVHGPVAYRFCFVVGPEFVTKRVADRAAEYRNIVENPPADDSCFDVVAVFREGAKGNYNYNTGSKSGSASTDASSGSTTGTSARLRALAASATGAAPGPSPSPQAESRLTVSLAQPLDAFWRISGEGNAEKVTLPSFMKQTNGTLTSVVQQQVQQRFGQAAPTIGTATDSTAFNAVDADILQRLLPSTFRGYTEAGSLTKQPQAFDGTDVLGLQPFNATTIKVVTAGAKLSSVNPLFNVTGQRLGVASVGWFHDSSLGESGTMFHVDQDVNSNLSVGISRVIGNTATPVSNAYVAYPNPNPALIAYPVSSPSPNPVLHRTNDVAGVLFKFGNGNDAAQPYEVFGRAGTTGYGRDYLAAISGSDLGNGHLVKEDGTTLGVSALAGYRSIGAAYAPLLTTYNPLSGTQMYFGRASMSLTVPQNARNEMTVDDRSSTLPYTLTIAGTYAKDGGIREYGSFGLSPSIPVVAKPKAWNPSYSVVGTFQRSYISATVIARQSGSFVYPPGPLNLLSNDSTTLSVQAQNPSDAKDWTAALNVGLSMSHSPNCSGTVTDPKCSSPFANKSTWGLNAGWKSVVLYANSAPGSQRTSSTSVSATIPANNVLTTALIAFHFCGNTSAADPAQGAWGAEPSLTFKNNIAQDGSAFQPGSLLEAGIDVGPSKGINFGVLGRAALSITYQNAVNTHGTPVALANHGFGISLITVSQAIWNVHKVKTDKCTSPDTPRMGGSSPNAASAVDHS